MSLAASLQKLMMPSSHTVWGNAAICLSTRRLASSGPLELQGSASQLEPHCGCLMAQGLRLPAPWARLLEARA